jgi:hypothetical protein
MTRAKAPTAWDIAKPLLEGDYVHGRVSGDMPSRDVRALRPEYEAVPLKNFNANWRALKSRVNAHKDRAEEDQARFLHDMTIYTLARDTDGFWDGSAAQQLLKQDVRNKRHERLTPDLLHLARPEYLEFDYNKFRKHLHQELRTQTETPYWIYKRMKSNN